jgi:hypothetical protein
VEVSPLSDTGFAEIRRVETKGAVGFEAKRGGKTYHVTFEVSGGRTSLRTE